MIDAAESQYGGVAGAGTARGEGRFFVRPGDGRCGCRQEIANTHSKSLLFLCDWGLPSSQILFRKALSTVPPPRTHGSCTGR